MPKRIQRKRIKGWKKPDNTIYVGRGSKWGNPFKVGSVILFDTVNRFMKIKDAKHACYLYKEAILPKLKGSAHELKGKNLMCWCPLDKECHADILLKIANEGSKNES